MGKSKLMAFDLPEGKLLSGKYTVLEKLGGGWEGEVYRIRETMTGIERAAKFFFPQRNLNNAAAKFYAKKLYKLRSCHILIQYLGQETLWYQNQKITYLISDYIEGVPLDKFLKQQRGGRLMAFQAVHLLHALTKGIESIHLLREYHGDLHPENIIVQRYGLGFDLKLIDMFHWGAPKPENLRDDICDVIRVFYDVLGGKKHYASQPQLVKDICCGLKRSLILKKFKRASQLRNFLETMSWDR